MSDTDRALLAARGAAVVHCPSSNMKLASGMFNLLAAQRAGVRWGLGTDGAATNNRLDMFSEMRTAALLAKVATGDPTVAPAAEVYQAATRGGFELMGLEGGEIAVGQLAHLRVVQYMGLAL